MKYSLSLLAGFALAFSTSADELYRWVDAEGKVHFGDRPPVEAKAESLDGRLKPINGADPTLRQDFPDTARSRQIEQEYAARKESQQSQSRQQQLNACKHARRQLQILKGRVYFVDENGKESTVSERERQQEAVKLEAQIRQHCG
ncbi:DUF4124 domain-containing protein [Microbulbifer pacificus]|uniref:DUF4124 domain-containing protein n=1 Tax=Microbulbifer pacificus TaxID=407164 RepID=A0AAU0MUN9_9GAMM|nr:DUF4124 domain-containing protein [Microbulbifer pacificus]WOX04177.1 DUF4124 domain-containing protein [Microbulbifer pacificus]